ncbi:bifunctional cobalt-precorrin-7 (C(5))-methyltransferase/cobalt-precorrin-6B (C(15))-methyltransferase [Paractinoplanes ferrugineus]|uniref:Precorrin-6Y C5,15-methyltransferase n=1 Tax=Paractinoplanes ferrugineus TaxID=113564 RepID=A0A919IWT5_9ACTN|nr:precorrin-6y C5,15-methyltransferase (decarboxylating) subunit CbiE [Actinoplanes ferrugineus]GIE09432.1 precorrin-6Y C5,15-methyltransferase [Actinoplanes ferrugineus]
MRDDTPGPVTVVGIGAGGWSDLAGTGRSALEAAEVIFGSPRQLDLVPPELTAERVRWPSPLLPALPGLFEDRRDLRICVLASGDPMFHGIGATLVRLLGPARVRVEPHPSSASLAAARMGWPLADTEVLSLVTADPAALRRVINPGRRILLLSRDAGTPVQVADTLVAAGFGAARLTVLERLGGPGERLVSGTADGWAHEVDPLHVIAVECGAGPARSVVPGLPDDAYESDGQLTKREVRAVTLALLAPVPGALLWDVGGGSGSIGIEWMRSHPACRAITVESDPRRCATIRANAVTLGVPALQVVEGRAPEALAELPTPDTVFIGGGLTRDGVLDACLTALRPGGRLVANAVTVESEAVVAAAHTKLGGELTRLSVSRGAPVGGFTGWRTMMPVTIWSVTR